MSGFNLSALAVRERSITLFLILLISVGGLYAFFKLGRAEDPAFTIKQMTGGHSLAWSDGPGDAGPGGRKAGKTHAGTALVR